MHISSRFSHISSYFSHTPSLEFFQEPIISRRNQSLQRKKTPKASRTFVEERAPNFVIPRPYCKKESSEFFHVPEPVYREELKSGVINDNSHIVFLSSVAYVQGKSSEFFQFPDPTKGGGGREGLGNFLYQGA